MVILLRLTWIKRKHIGQIEALRMSSKGTDPNMQLVAMSPSMDGAVQTADVTVDSIWGVRVRRMRELIKRETIRFFYLNRPSGIMDD